MKSPWTHQMDMEMKLLIESGLSTAQTAKELNRRFRAGLTKNAVVGRWYRKRYELRLLENEAI